MKNENISHVLKYYRKLNNLSVSDVAGMLCTDSRFVAEKTVYGWESGQTQPDADTLLHLCRLYKIPDILTTFGYDNKGEELRLTEFELNLILKYREKTEMQEAVKKLLDLR